MSHPVSLYSDLRPLVQLLNRDLEGIGAEPVQKDELDTIDGLLQAALRTEKSDATRCPHCGGYTTADWDGEPRCLNCARPVAASGRMLDEVAHKIAMGLMAARAGESA